MWRAGHSCSYSLLHEPPPMSIAAAAVELDVELVLDVMFMPVMSMVLGVMR